MQSVFSAVLGSSLVGSVVILAVLGLRNLLARAPRKYICLLWAVVLLRLLWLAPMELPFGLIPWQWHEAPAALFPGWDIELEDTLGAAGKAVLGTAFGSEDLLVRTAADELKYIGMEQYWFAVLSWIWLGGILVLAVRAVLDSTRLKGHLDAAVQLDEGVYELPGLETAFVMGIRRTRIYLPAGLDPERRALILQHERTHIARWDPLWKLLGYITLTVHWFNPLCRYAYRVFIRDMEIACDQSVSAEMDAEARAGYAQAVLDLATGLRPADAPMAFSEGDTGHRVREILSWRKPGKGFTALAMTAVAVCGLLLLGDRMAQSNVLGSRLEPLGVLVFDNRNLQSGCEEVPPLRMDADGSLYHLPIPGTILEGTAQTEGGDWTLLGRAEPYSLTWRELKGYIGKYPAEKLTAADRWSLRNIRSAWILHPGSGTTGFFLVIRTRNDRIYVASGMEDTSERYDWLDDDTTIYWIARMEIVGS